MGASGPAQKTQMGMSPASAPQAKAKDRNQKRQEIRKRLKNGFVPGRLGSKNLTDLLNAAQERNMEHEEKEDLAQASQIEEVNENFSVSFTI